MTEHAQNERTRALEVRMDRTEERLDVHAERIDDLRTFKTRMITAVLIASTVGASFGAEALKALAAAIRGGI